MITPPSAWVPPSMLPTTLDPKKRLAIDLETYDPHLTERGPGWATGDGHVVGIAVAADNYQGYFPIRHEGGGNLEEAVVLRWLKGLLSTHKAPVIFHNALYDVGWLRREGISHLPTSLVDTMFAAPLVDEHSVSYSLNHLGQTYCDETKDESLLQDAALSWGINPKSELYKLPSRYVGPYAEQDAALTLKLWTELETHLKAQSLEDVFQLECDLIPLILEMRWRGVRVDQDRAEQVGKDLSTQEQQLLVEIKRKFGTSVDMWASASLQKIFDANDLFYPRTDKGAPSFQGPWLESHTHELPRMIVQARRLNKARTTFVEKMIMDHMVDGRIHAELHPLRNDNGGTVSGRFSYSNPNLQQVPARDPVIGKMIRSLFIPEDDTRWGTFDYSQQEPRLTVHYAQKQKLPGAEEAVAAYTANADFHQIVADMAGISRKHAKTVNLGLTYGMGQKKLLKELGINQTEARDLLDAYHAKVPFLRGLQDQCTRTANHRGFIRTLGGRRCRFEQWEPVIGEGSPLPRDKAENAYGSSIKRSYTYRALNRLIQGSAADMTKIAMRDSWAMGHVPHLQIHDELDYSVESDAQSQEIQELMTHCVDLVVPLKVDVEYGDNWGNIQ